MMDEFFLEDLGEALLELASGVNYELGFEPAEAREPIGGFVKEIGRWGMNE